MPHRIELKKRWGRGMYYVPILAVACLGLVSAALAWVTVSAWEERLAKQAFNDVAGDYGNVLQSGIDRYLEKLIAVRAFYDSSHQVDPNEFSLFTDRLLGPNRSQMWLSWSPLVNQVERAAFESQARGMGFLQYQINAWAPAGTLPSAPEQAEYFPVLYQTFEPDLGPLLGVDLSSEPLRRAAIDRARDNDIMATAIEVNLREPAAGKTGFFVALPVYRAALPHDTITTRRTNLRGILAGTFETKALIDQIMTSVALPLSVDFYLFPSPPAATVMPIYRHTNQPTNGVLSRETIEQLKLGPHWELPVKIGDASWQLLVTPPGGTLTRFHRAWLAAAGVILMFGALLAYLWASLNYARRLEKANDRIMQLADTDLLTSLANRRAFIKQLTLAHANARRGSAPFAVLYLDIDDFKDVNDTLGHPMGDHLIRGVVDRLQATVRESDVVSRFGGDEFAILQSNVTDASGPSALATTIGKALAAPFLIKGHEINITSSIGISVFSPTNDGPDTMMVQADLALYRAKADGRNRFCFHTADLDQQVRERVRVTEELRAAIENDELELHYQPQVEIATGRIIGAEALVRWNHKSRGLVAPGQFIAIAERTGVIVPLGQWILNDASRQLKQWQVENIAPPVLAVNVSGVQLRGTAEFGRDVEETLARWDIDPGHIELELTESVLMDATQRHSGALFALRHLGTKIAIDDFGTGYSSLKYLTIYPVSRLKLAQEFVFRVAVDYRKAAVVRAAIRLANELGIEVIAEGVETEAQMHFLMAAGCRQAQGFYYSRPVPAAEMTEMLRRGTTNIEPTPLSKGKSSAA
jgi:diguanylate cyclase (GGDEF)-like protein